MNRESVIERLRSYFNIYELVGKREYERDGELCWRYFRTEFLEALLAVREDILGVPMTVNTWYSGGGFDERGFRTNVSDTVKAKTLSDSLYISPHMLGCAIDFDAKGMEAEEARKAIEEAASSLPHPVRLEAEVGWVHLDTYDNGNGNKVTYFKG